jgi:transcriptional regulator of heat shock response
MNITERQKEILDSVIGEYIKLAQPVSSQLIEKKYDFGICPATIRIEMQKLTDKGFLCQPHTSAGRVPTDKGLRLFVDNLLEKELKNFEIASWLKDEDEDDIKFIQGLTKNLAHISGALALGYLEKENVFWKEGWEEILKEPEFGEKDFALNFAEFLENFENNIGNFEINSGIKIYIGKENPFKKAKDFTVITSKCHLPAGDEVILSLLGPKRMAYDTNIGLIKSLAEALAEAREE